MSQNTNERGTVEIRHSKKIMASYSAGYLISDFMGAVLGVILFAFYETEIGLNTLMTGAALVIFAIWDAVNDPVVGYFSDRPYRFTKKWGRRFPLIVGSFIPMVFTFVLIFYPPLNANQWAIFAWLIVTTCVFDTLESIFVTNFYGLFPDKFRNHDERITTSSISTVFTVGGAVLGGVIPPMIIVFGEINSWVLMAWITLMVCMFCFPFIIPGVKDDKENVDAFLENYEESEKEPLFATSFKVLKHRNLIMYLVLILLYFTLTNSMAGSLLYYAQFVLNMTEGDIASTFLATMFGGALLSIPLWLMYVRKSKDNKAVMVYGGIVMAITAMAFSFLNSIVVLYGLFFIMGLGVGGFLVLMTPTFSDVVDESVVLTGERNEGLLGGYRFFMMNLSRVIMSIIIAVVHTSTGFIEGSDFQPSAAILGIRLHAGFIPAIFMLVGVILFWKYYDLTPQKTQMIKEELEGMKI